jgi:hypothetical protein
MHDTINLRSIKFRALAEQRVSKVLNIIQRIGNLSRRPTYEYSQEQVAKIFGAMRAALDEAESKFAPTEKKHQLTFRLD